MKLSGYFDEYLDLSKELASRGCSVRRQARPSSWGAHQLAPSAAPTAGYCYCCTGWFEIAPPVALVCACGQQVDGEGRAVVGGLLASEEPGWTAERRRRPDGQECSPGRRDELAGAAGCGCSCSCRADGNRAQRQQEQQLEELLKCK